MGALINKYQLFIYAAIIKIWYNNSLNLKYCEEVLIRYNKLRKIEK